MTEDETIALLYPDLVEAGGLLSAVRTALVGKQAGLQINGFGTGLSYAHVQYEQRSAQIFIGIDNRRFDFDLWHEGVAQAAGDSAEFNAVMLAIEQWILKDRNVVTLMQEFSFIHQRRRKKHE